MSEKLPVMPMHKVLAKRIEKIMLIIEASKDEKTKVP